MFVSTTDVLNFVNENDVKFIRLSFCDVKGNMKNIAIMADELPDAIQNGIQFDALCLERNNPERYLLIPDLSTMSVLPWRPQSGKVIRFFCNIFRCSGAPYEGDLRMLLRNVVNEMNNAGLSCEIGTKCEFYLFKNDEYGNPTKEPADNGGYLDVSPLDNCENIRREICLSLEEMGINPQKSCHKRGPGQNEIDFICSDPLTAADNMMQYKSVVKAIAAQNGLYASFMPKPLRNWDGSAFSITFHIKRNKESIFGSSNHEITEEGRQFMAGILKYTNEITVFTNPITNSYKRLGTFMAPKYADWSENFSNPSLLVTNSINSNSHLVFRTADAACNPYMAALLLLSAGMRGISEKMTIPSGNEKIILPSSLEQALGFAEKSSFVADVLPPAVLNEALSHFRNMAQEYQCVLDSASSEDAADEYDEKKFFYTI